MVGDLNRDGKPDVAVASVQDNSSQTGNLDVFLGNGEGTFQGVISTPNVAVWRGALGDLNGDGVLDFVGDRYAPEQVEIWLGQGDGRFTKGATYSMNGYYPDVVQVGDLNGDSILDLVVPAELTDGTPAAPLSIFLGKGDGTFQSGREFTPLTGGLVFNFGPRLRDFNEDGLLDIVSVAGYTTEQPHDLAVALNQGVKRDPNLGFLLKMQNSISTPAGSAVLEASSNLMDWMALATNATPTGLWSIVDTNAGLQQRYYRTRRNAQSQRANGQPTP